ncbi:HAMP domain-containing sensor histidine kinase [Metabacillus fastidiosus]|uniref:sensor histidine kinase n=1 Tax=Metabacillus fastidiosus TaxID=1458 RepID=UPI002DBD0EFD|nr:HAMP domain-containing sensor histidine kinase [Metabacillus fastidiosus]MEC2076450.1 HAMP domain-containing sensor histidine kinase [Metabacillus fastidiosus]
MKNKSLSFQIWLVFSGILLAISILLIILFPTTLRDFFTKEIYKSIENEQRVLTEFGNPDSSVSDPDVSLHDRSVEHIILPENRSFFFYSSDLPANFITYTQKLASEQTTISKRYSEDINGNRLFYVIRKLSVNGESSYLLSYTWDSYRQTLVFTLFRQLMLIMIIVFLLSWIPAIWLAKYLSKPLITLEKHVKNISEQEWHEEINVNRKDEIGKLAETIEKMRQHLVRKDAAQQTLLQNISHDLKTPVMVIRGYAQSVKDGIYPKGDLLKSMDVIEEEAERLEKKIKDLLYLTKLDFLSSRNPIQQEFQLDSLVLDKVERLKWMRSDLNWNVNIEKLQIAGDKEQWGKLIENLLENALRYAKNTIDITIKNKEIESAPVIRIWNDGPPIDEAILDKLFEPFQKGQQGEFGLGLSIVKQIALLHKAQVSASNELDGAAFYVRF